MRWEITKTIGDVHYVDEGQYTKKIADVKKEKVQYITVGDIIAKGKSAAGAVGDLVNRLPGFIEGLKADGSFPGSVQLANSLYGIAQPLAIMIQGLEVYKAVMSVIDTLTPIMKTVARASGIWCSPGNVADLAQIALGTVQQVLIGIAISAIIKLKNWIWSFEFPIRKITEEDQEVIDTKLRRIAKEQESNPRNPCSDIDPNTGKRYTIDPRTQSDYNNARNNALEKLRGMFGGKGEGEGGEGDDKDSTAITEADANGIVNQLFGENPTDEQLIKGGSNCKNNYMTEFHPTGDPTFVRMLGGSDHDTGIYYSDDKGHTWKQSNIKDGSFKKFAKIPLDNGEYVYIAASCEYVKNLKSLESLNNGFEKDEINRYNKDYYKKDRKGKIDRLEKIKKEGLEKKYSYNLNAIAVSNLAMDKNENIGGKGLYYSKDNGLTWTKSNKGSGSFENLFEYKEKEGCKATVVASSYDYKGVYYTKNGEVWEYSSIVVDGIRKPISTGRWVELSDSESSDPKIYADGLNAKFSILSKIQPEFGFKNVKPSAVTVVTTSGGDIDIGLDNDNSVEIPEKKSLFKMAKKYKSDNKVTNAKININCNAKAIVGEGLESANNFGTDMNASEEARSIIRTIKIMHDKIMEKPNGEEILKTKSNIFWRDHIIAIKEGTYTEADAKNGKDLD